MILDLTQITK